jgi:hypothetical protein
MRPLRVASNCFIDMEKRTGPRNMLHLMFDPHRLRPDVHAARQQGDVISLRKVNKRKVNDMKRKPNPQRADRENPAWTKETFARARKARDVLPEIFCCRDRCQDVEAPWTTEVGQGAYIGLSPIAAGDIGSLEGHGSGWQTFTRFMVQRAAKPIRKRDSYALWRSTHFVTIG